MASLNICLEACFGNGWGRQTEYHPPPPISHTPCFPADPQMFHFKTTPQFSPPRCFLFLLHHWSPLLYLPVSLVISVTFYGTAGYWNISEIIFAPLLGSKNLLRRVFGHMHNLLLDLRTVSLVNGQVTNLLLSDWSGQIYCSTSVV